MIGRAALALVLAPGLAIAAPAAPAPAAPAPADDAAPPIEPDARAVDEAREANLVPESVREGFAFGVALGPAMQLGYGISDATGRGFGLNLRFGTVASPRWIWLLELSITGYPREDAEKHTHVNQSAVATFGGQLYVNEGFWLRGGAGFASFTRRTDDTETAQFGGLGVTGAGGFDLIRRRGLAMSLEGMSSLALYGDGTVLGASVQLGLAWY